MLGTREYTLCSPFRANAHNSSSIMSCAVSLQHYYATLLCGQVMCGEITVH